MKPLPPNTNSDPTSSSRAPTGSPREDHRARGPCSHFGKPLTNTRSLPALSVDTWEQSPLGDVAPPPPPEEADPPTQRTVPVLTTAPSPVGSNDRCHLMLEEEQYYSRNLQASAPVSDSKGAPPLSANLTRKWSCLHLDQPDAVDSPVDPPILSPHRSPTDSPPPPPPPVLPPPPLPARLRAGAAVGGWGRKRHRVLRPPLVRTASLSLGDYRAALPVERWAENVNRYYGSQNASGVGSAMALDEELSELDSLYQASLLAPSMHRGSRGVSPQPTNNRPGGETSLIVHQLSAVGLINNYDVLIL